MQKNSRKGYAVQVTKITKNQAKEIGKAATYLGISTVVSYLLTILTEQPELLGVFTPIVNVILVAVKKLFTVEAA